MANAKIGGKGSYSQGAYLEKLDSDRTLTLGDSGRIFLIANTAAISVILPDVSNMSTQEKESAIGWNCQFIVQSISGGTATIGCSSGDGNLLFGNMVGSDGSSSNVGLDAVADDISVTTNCVAGDMVRLLYDGTYYYVHGQQADNDHITLA
jgi:hypothetical protein